MKPIEPQTSGTSNIIVDDRFIEAELRRRNSSSLVADKPELFEAIKQALPHCQKVTVLKRAKDDFPIINKRPKYKHGIYPQEADWLERLEQFQPPSKRPLDLIGYRLGEEAIGGHWRYIQAHFSGGVLQEPNWTACRIEHSGMVASHLQSANLYKCLLSDVDMRHASLRGGNWGYVVAREVDWDRANLLGVHFEGCDLRGVKHWETALFKGNGRNSEAVFIGCTLPEGMREHIEAAGGKVFNTKEEYRDWHNKRTALSKVPLAPLLGTLATEADAKYGREGAKPQVDRDADIPAIVPVRAGTAVPDPQAIRDAEAAGKLVRLEFGGRSRGGDTKPAGPPTNKS